MPPAGKKSFEFWIGRAGSGKTLACVEAIAGHLRENPRGRPLLLLVPEQASAQMERALVMAPGVGGFTRARVITFKFLQREALAAAGDAARDLIDDEARVILLRGSLRRNAARLKLIGAHSNPPGLAEAVAQTLVEFQRYGWSPAQLRERVAALEAEDALSQQALWKLQDLTLLWQDHHNDLASRGLLDDAAAHERAMEAIRRWDELDGSRLWIDGFASFTAQERGLLEALLERVDAAHLALLLDPERDSFREKQAFLGRGLPTEELWRGLDEFEARSAGRLGPDRIFSVVERAWARLSARLLEIGWTLKYQEFPRPDLPTRHGGSAALAHMERELTAALRPALFDENAWRDEAASFSAWPPGPMELIEADDRRCEVEAVAERLVALNAAGLDWADAAILTRDLDAYAPHVREVFPRFGIPFFLDQTREIASHPLSRVILSALRILSDGWTTPRILDYLKTGLTPLGESDEIARLENFAHESRLIEPDWRDGAGAGSRVWSEGDGPAMRAAWATAAKPILVLEGALTRPKPEPARALWEYLESLRAAETLDAWVDAARAEADEETALIHQAAWRQALDTLDRLHQLGVGADPDELLESAETGLATVRGGLIPPTLNQVLVGSVDRTRTPPARLVCVLGMNDGEFPRVYDEDPMLGDADRRALATGGREIGPDTAARYAQERYLAYVALTRSSERLIVTRPMTGDGDRPSGRSSFFRALVEMFPFAPVTRRPRDARMMEAGLAESRPRPLDIWAGEVARSLHEARAGRDPARLARALAGPHPIEIAGALGELVRRRVERVFEALEPPRPASLDPALAGEFWRADPRLSATSLEAYGACPFMFLLNRALRLRPRAEATPGAMERGVLRHYLLDYLFHELRGDARGLDWGKIHLERAGGLIDAALEEILAGGGPRDIDFSRGAFNRATARIVAREMRGFLRALKAMGERYAFDQVGAELRFRDKDGTALEMKTMNVTGEEIAFKIEGAADRIDEARFRAPGSPIQAIVYDYKSGRRSVSAARLREGLDLQPLFYALALEDARRREGAAPVEVGGMFYWPIGMGALDADGEPDAWAEPGSAAWFKKHRVEGIFAESLARLIDTQAAEGIAPLAFNFKWNKGMVALSAANNGWLPDAAFRRAITDAESLIRERVRQIAAGRIDIAPVTKIDTPCQRCEGAGVCRKDWMESVPYRRIATLHFRDYRKELAGEPLTEKPKSGGGRGRKKP